MVDFIVDNNLSFNIAQSPSLQQMLERVSGRKIIIPSRRKFMKSLDDEFEKMQKALKDLLQKQKFLCLTADVWSSRARDHEIESEVSRYLMDHRKENSMLNECPHIRRLFLKFNTTLSSSAPVERVFSQSMMIFTPRRNRISGAKFEKTLLLKHNRMLIKKSNEK